MNDAERVAAAPANALAAWLADGLPADVFSDFLAEPRFAVRLREIAVHRLGALPRLEARHLAALALTPAGLPGFALRVGALWHAARLARVVEAGARRRLIAALGQDAYVAALRGRHLGPDHTDTGMEQGTDSLVALAAHDGSSCWSAWCSVQPAPIEARLRLLGGGSPFGPAHATFGPPIVDWLLDPR